MDPRLYPHPRHQLSFEGGAARDPRLYPRPRHRLSFRRRRRTKPPLCHPTLAPTEESTFGMLVARRTAGPVRYPPAAPSGSEGSAAFARAAASGFTVAESRFLGPATRGTRGRFCVAGPQNDRLRLVRLNCHSEGGAARTPPCHRTLAPTEESTFGMLVTRRTAGYSRRPPVAPSGSAVSAAFARAAASGLAVAESRFFGPATRGARGRFSAAGPQNDRLWLVRLNCHSEGGAARTPRLPPNSGAD
jgi:hypothetical protein